MWAGNLTARQNANVLAINSKFTLFFSAIRKSPIPGVYFGIVLQEENLRVCLREG